MYLITARTAALARPIGQRTLATAAASVAKPPAGKPSPAPPSPLVLSGIQPTGIPHLGNYLGALQHWVALQSGTAPVLYSIVDLHALTAHPPVSPSALRDSIADTARLLLATGIDPDRSVLFQQSRVAGHTQLQWVLTCGASMGWLARMTQWKTKAGTAVGSDAVPPGLKMGLFAYPVLMAADILIYRATQVPVGEDQHQHLELARTLAKHFNATYKTDLFPLPNAMTTPSSKRIMSLTDPTAKMSKSHPSAFSRIHLTDTDAEITKKIRRAVTDADPAITWSPASRPGVANLLSLYAACAGVADPATLLETGGELAGVSGHAALKARVADRIVATVQPVRDAYVRLGDDPAYVQAVLEKGNGRAREIADQTWSEVSKVIGIA
ncbi:Tryptophan--tRNA ligase, mitochondrial [Blastocladiella emersonii ATCC 22665]|nr:Tryptophan--tRNA ligase, mitochondrial [Blastocladiella emersonii ATCC 22665]